MRVKLNSISGIDDAIACMFLSKRTWTEELDSSIRDIVQRAEGPDGGYGAFSYHLRADEDIQFDKWMRMLCKIGAKHITLLRFVDFSFTVQGLHRGGQDDWDSHAARFNNRIIRSSTRLADFGHEKSDYYKGKILTMDDVIKHLTIVMPNEITYEGETYVKAVNGYIRKGLEELNDVKRGLYMLSIPSNFIFRVNLTEFAHVYKERGQHGTANPEVKQLAEMCANEIEYHLPWVTRELLMEIKN